MNKAVVFVNPAPSKSPQISAFKFLKVIAPFFSKVSIVSTNLDETPDAEVFNVKYKKQSNPVLRVLGFILFQFRLLFKSLSVVKKGDFVFFWIGDKMFTPMLVSKLKGAKTYFFHYQIPTLESDSRKARSTVKGQNFMARVADFVCAESPAAITDRGLALDERTKILHLFVDDLQNDSIKENKIGMLCRIAKGKCVLESIEAFAQFHTLYPQYTLEIVGDGIQFDECKNKIEELKARDYIIMHGWLSHDELFKIMPEWKLLLFPTKTEGLPNSVLESMSMSIPALCSTAGGLKDMITDNVNGYILPDEEVDTIYKKLCYIFESDTLEYVSQQAKDTINNKYTLEKARENFKSQMGF